MKYPELVTRLCTNCEAWIIGSAADPKNTNIRDYDIFVPITHWTLACSIIPKDATVNRMGGFKCMSEGIEVDVWTCDMAAVVATNYFKWAYHPKTGVRIKRV